MRELSTVEQININGGANYHYWLQDTTTGEEWSYPVYEFAQMLNHKLMIELKGHSASYRKVNLDL